MVPRRLTARAAQALADAEASQSARPPAAGPIRFRPQITMFGLLATVASGLYVYSEKHAAAALDRDIAHAYQATEAAHRESSLLRAEWALMNNPDRLHPLADRYLALEPLRAAQFVKVADLHSRLPKILYGPPVPPSDDDPGVPIVTKRLLAMAEMPAPTGSEPAAADAAAPDAAAQQTSARPVQESAAMYVPQHEAPQQEAELQDTAPQSEPAQPAQQQDAPEATLREAPRTPVVAGPKHAYRVLAHAGALPAIVDTDSPAADAADEGRSGVIEETAPKPAYVARAPRPAALLWHQPARQAPTQPAAPRLVAHAEPKPRLFHEPTLLRPELVHMLMLPHTNYAQPWAGRAAPDPVKPAPPEHHLEYGRSDPPHFLTAPAPAPAKPPAPQQYAEARPRAYERQYSYVPPATYRAPPPYAYRPYWGGYYQNPYSGYYAQRPAYPSYQ